MRLPPPLARPLAQIRAAIAILDFSTAYEAQARIEEAMASIRGRVSPAEAIDLALRALARDVDALVSALRSQAEPGGAPEAVIHELRKTVASGADMVEGLLEEARPSAMAIVSGMEW